MNPENEILVKQILSKHLTDVSITLSYEVLPEIKEYERTSTVAVNGYVMPKMKFYLQYLEKELKTLEISSDLYIMQSNGGVISTDKAVEMPVRTVLSGPAGGVIAAGNVADMTGHGNLITIDMGGTSLDTALIANGKPQYTTTSKIEDYPIHVPMVEMHTIGSGGGSIAWIDSGGALRVGPHSAGADPGPVCYGKGGTEPTVSDANVILGRINPDSILGGRMKMDIERAREVIQEKIANPLGITVEEAAEGILKVVNANMVRGIRVISVEKGHDSRDFSLLAFGGAGPLHAGDIANELGCKNIIIPPNPGIMCATGMLMADVRHDYVQSLISVISALQLDDANKRIMELKNQAFTDLTREGFHSEIIDYNVSLDLRYRNQAYELNIPLSGMVVNEGALQQAIKDFHITHEKVYGFNRLEEDLEVVNIRLIAFGRINKPKQQELSGSVHQNPLPIAERDVFFQGDFYPTAVYQREDLHVGFVLHGPAIIEQLDSTIVIHPNQQIQVDEYNNLLIQNSTQGMKEVMKRETAKY